MTSLLLRTPAARPCVHPTAHHPHGSVLRYQRDRCRCRSCREAQAAYAAERNLAISYGRWTPFADAHPTRARLRRLTDRGFSQAAIAELAGVSETTVRDVLHGRRDGLPTRVRTVTAEAIRAVMATDDGGTLIGRPE